MDKAVVIGNCQAAALEMMLNTNDQFAQRFEFVSFPPVHEIPAELIPELHEAVAAATLVFPQRVDEGYREGIGLGTQTLADLAGSATVVRWPSVYWAGYFPDLFYLRDAHRQPVTDGPFDYHDRVILESYVAGLSAAEACAVLTDPERPSDAEAWTSATTAELKIREQDCDVRLAPFIAARYRRELLFFSMNHPANVVLGEMARQITNLIGIPGVVDYRKLSHEVLSPTFYPLHANHVRALGLEFGAEYGAGGCSFRIRGVEHEPEHAVRAFFDYYAAHPDLVQINVTR